MKGELPLRESQSLLLPPLGTSPKLAKISSNLVDMVATSMDSLEVLLKLVYGIASTWLTGLFKAKSSKDFRFGGVLLSSSSNMDGKSVGAVLRCFGFFYSWVCV